MSFFLQKVNPNAPDVKDLYICWGCINHTQGYKNKQNLITGPSGPKWENAQWTEEGTHTVVCTVQRSLLGNAQHYEYVQRVISAKDCLSYDNGSHEETGNPFNVMHNVDNQITLIRQLESKSQLTEDANTKYQERITNMETYRDKLKYLLNKIPDSHKEHFNFITARHYSGAYPDSNSISLQVCYFYADNTVYLLDWTNPMMQGWCGVFEGTGKTEKDAIVNALNNWKSNNRYPEGLMECSYLYYSHPTLEIPKRNGEGLIYWDIYDHNYHEKHQFKTDGSTWLDDISNILSWIAIGAAVVAGAILIFVPGGQAGTYVLWVFAASSVSATAAIGSASINITQRYNTGFSNWKDDGLYSLTIAASLLGLGSLKALTKWGPLAMLANESQNLAKVNTIKVMLIGQVTADSVQGIMISTDIASAIYSTIEDPSIAADEKLSRILRLLAAGVTTGALTYINIKGTSAQFGFLKKDTSLLRKMSTAEVDAMLNNPNAIIIEHGELTSSTTQLATIPKESVAIKQLQELSILPNNEANSRIANANNILVPEQRYLQQVNTSYEPERWIKNELSKSWLFNEPYEATRLLLLSPTTKNMIAPIVKVNNQAEAKTVVITQVKQNVNHDNIAKLEQIARSMGLKDAAWKEKVALSRATCTVEGITFDNATNFYNLPFDLELAIKAGVAVKNGEFTQGNAPIKVLDIDRYINELNQYYPGDGMHQQTKTLIKNYLVQRKDNLSNLRGMPGAHAEIQAVDDVFWQLANRGLNPKLYLDKIEVYTLKTNRPQKNDTFLKAFKACENCSGILDPKIIIHTGRQGE